MHLENSGHCKNWARTIGFCGTGPALSPGLQARAEDLSSSYLDEPVERNDVADGVGEELENGEVGEDDPVGQPLEEKK